MWKKWESKVWLLLLFAVLPGGHAGKNAKLGIIALMQREKTELCDFILPLNDKTQRPFPEGIVKINKYPTLQCTALLQIHMPLIYLISKQGTIVVRLATRFPSRASGEDAADLPAIQCRLCK